MKPALVVGDENPIRQAAGWRQIVTKQLKIPLWTVDAGVFVPTNLLEKAQYGAHVIRPQLQARLKDFLIPATNPKAKFPWKRPASMESLALDVCFIEGWRLDRGAAGCAMEGGPRKG